MTATDPIRIEIGEHLVRHSAVHQARFWAELAKLPELTGAPASESLERGLYWSFEYRHAVEDLRTALEYGAYDAYERFVCRNHQVGIVHTNVAFPVSDTVAGFEVVIPPSGKAPLWNFRERAMQITAVFRSAQPFAGD